MAEDLDLLLYRKAFDEAERQGYSSNSADLFAEWVVGNRLDRIDTLNRTREWFNDYEDYLEAQG